MSAIIPYIAYFLPNTQVTPLILKHNTSKVEINVLVEKILKLTNPNTVVIAAVDFSHYFDFETAEKKDAHTRELLLALDYESILTLGPNFNDYLDSPPAIALLLIWASKKGIKTINIIDHANSGEFLRQKKIPTTSYFEAVL